MLLEMKGVSKSFYNVKALNNVPFSLNKGEVHALVGENGAGKSTLMKIIAGIYVPDEGEILLNGKNVHITSPSVSQQMGISIIHQELNLIPYLTVAENIFLGREPHKFGFVDFKKMAQETLELLNRVGLTLDPKALIHTLSIGEQQVVEIAKALSLKSEILIMDEPTAVLTERETEKLFELIKELKHQGVSIIYISHRLSELKILADRITVLRDGKWITTRTLEGLIEKDIANLMVGRELNDLFPSLNQTHGEELLRVEQLTKNPHFKNISFSVKAGEILGFAGLMGAGRSELASTIFGEMTPDSGKIYWKKKEIKNRNPKEAIKRGFGFATEDRKQSGLNLEMSIAKNITLPTLQKISNLGFVNRRVEKKLVNEKVNELKIKLYSINQPVKNLSGGNQQKVVLSKWLLAETELFFLDEPTRGIDVGAKNEIYHLISDLAAQGKGVILISSELPELLGICHRIIVMSKGEKTGELQHSEANEETIMAMATGLVERG